MSYYIHIAARNKDNLEDKIDLGRYTQSSLIFDLLHKDLQLPYAGLTYLFNQVEVKTAKEKDVCKYLSIDILEKALDILQDKWLDTLKSYVNIHTTKHKISKDKDGIWYVQICDAVDNSLKEEEQEISENLSDILYDFGQLVFLINYANRLSDDKSTWALYYYDD